MAEHFCFRDPSDPLQLRLHNAEQVVRHFRWSQVLTVKCEIHERERIAGPGVNDRIVGVIRQHVPLACHFGLDLRHGRVGVIVQLHEHFDH